MFNEEAEVFNVAKRCIELCRLDSEGTVDVSPFETTTVVGEATVESSTLLSGKGEFSTVTRASFAVVDCKEEALWLAGRTF